MGCFREKKYGFFAHYVWEGRAFLQNPVIKAIYPDGTLVQTVEEMIEQFDAKQFAEDMREFGVEYVIFTSYHFNMNPLYPSEVFRRWRIHGEDNPEKADLIERIYWELKRYNIDLYLYIHPHDIHDFCKEDQARFQYWGDNREARDNRMDRKKWQDYISESFRELMERYKGKIKGVYLDEAYGDPAKSVQMNDYERIRDDMKGVDPDTVMIQNYYGNCYTLDTGMLENAVIWHGAVYDCVDTWATTKYSSGTVFRNCENAWWANFTVDQKPVNAVLDKYPDAERMASAEDMYRYTLFEAGQNLEGGGTAWAAGPYCGFWIDADGQKQIWEPGVRDTMKKLGQLLKPVMSSISQTIPSKSFVTIPGTRIGEVRWGSATESQDGKYTFLHIIKPPVDSLTLYLGKIVDDKEFHRAFSLSHGREILLRQEGKEVWLTLPEGCMWDKLATVVQLS